MAAVELPGGQHVEERDEEPYPRGEQDRREEHLASGSPLAERGERRRHEQRLSLSPLLQDGPAVGARRGQLGGYDGRLVRPVQGDQDGDGQAGDGPSDRDVEEYYSVDGEAPGPYERAERRYAVHGYAGYEERPGRPDAVPPRGGKVAGLVDAEYAEQRDGVHGGRLERVADVQHGVCRDRAVVPVDHYERDDGGEQQARHERLGHAEPAVAAPRHDRRHDVQAAAAHGRGARHVHALQAARQRGKVVPKAGAGAVCGAGQPELDDLWAGLYLFDVEGGRDDLDDLVDGRVAHGSGPPMRRGRPRAPRRASCSRAGGAAPADPPVPYAPMTAGRQRTLIKM